MTLFESCVLEFNAMHNIIIILNFLAVMQFTSIIIIQSLSSYFMIIYSVLLYYKGDVSVCKHF